MTSVPATAAAAGLAFFAALLSSRRPLDRHRRISRDSTAQPTGARTRRSSGIEKTALAFAGVWLLRTSGPRVLTLAGGAVIVGWVSSRLLAGWRRREARSRSRVAVIEFCDALSAELEAGLPAVTAMERAGASWLPLSGVVNAARLGDDVAEALRSAASSTPGAEGLRSVAAAWDVAAHSGAALAVVLARVGAGLRCDEEAHSEVIAALGPPRATAKMLAVLPLFGIALGVSMGTDPLSFLLQTTVGSVCLVTGTAMALAGLWWVERLASAVEA
jgi:tight adherence protein B